jgi:heat shock protein 4
MKGQLKVLGHVFDMHIGVRDFDYVLYEHFSAEIKKKYGIDLAEDKKNSIRLLSSIDKLKKVLSANALAPLNCEMGEVDVQFQNITREFAEELWAPMLANFTALMEKVKAIPGAENLFAVEILGGGSRIPSIKAALAAVLGKPVQTTLNASESVAKGCGIMGAMLSPKFKVREFSVIDSNVFTVNLGYHSEKSSNPVSDPNFPEINKKMVVLKPGDACPKTLNLTFDRTQDFELFVFNEACAEIGSTASDLLVGKWKVSQIPAVADSSVRVRLRISPSMLISVEGAFVTEELEEEEEVVEAPKSPKSPKEAPEAGDAAAAPMETDKKEEPKKVMRKKKKTHECVVSVLATAGHNEAKLKTMTDLEVSMVASDVNVRDTAEMKNSLEEYILSMRSKVAESGIYGPYMSEADRKPFLASCTSVEDWLYDDGDDAAKDDYAQKLTDLKRLGEPPVQRYQSGQKLVPAIAAFKTKAAELKAQAADPDGKLAHIPGVELHTVTQKCDECLAWLESEVARNAAAPKTVAPLLDASTVLAKQNEMNTFCLPILSTPKPKEEPKPEPPADAPAEGEKAEEKPADAKMDLD